MVTMLVAVSTTGALPLWFATYTREPTRLTESPRGMTATDATTVTAGAQMGFVITVANSSTTGTGTAAAVTLADPLPSGTNVLWSIASQPGGNPCSLTATPPQSLSCTFGDLAPGGSKSIHLTSPTTRLSCASYANTATASATNKFRGY